MGNNREVKIIEVLINANEPVSIVTLSHELNVSHTTIRNSLVDVEILARESNLTLERKRGVGVKIKGSSLEKKKFLQSHVKVNRSFSKNDQLDYLLMELVDTNKTYITIEDLSSSLFLSRTTIQNYLVELGKTMLEYNIILETKKKKGVRVIGEETDIRNLYSKAMSRQNGKVYGTSDLRIQIFKTLRIDPDYIFVSLRKFQEHYDYLFSDESFDSLVIHIAISIRRIMDNQLIEQLLDNDTANFEFEYEVSKKIAKDIESHYKIHFNDAEVYFLFLHLISTKVIKERNKVPKVSKQEKDNIVYLIAKEIVELVENTRQIIVIDRRFIDNLIIHLRPTINRIEFKFQLENPLKDMIKQEYPVAYGLAWMSNSIFKHYLGSELNEDEVSFIAVHIQSILEASEHKLRVIVVCSSGVGISQLLVSRLNSLFPNLNIIASESVYSFSKHSNPDRADLVLATFPVETNIPLIIVNPLLSKNDIDTIQEYIQDFQYGRNLKHLEDEFIVETLLRKKWKSQDEVIVEVAKYLELKQLVNHDFVDEIYKREAINSTSIGMKVALPHATYETVKKTSISFVTLQKPILWGEDMVDLIMFISLTEKDSHRLSHRLREIYLKLYSEELHNELIGAQNHESFVGMIFKKEIL